MPSQVRPREFEDVFPIFDKAFKKLTKYDREIAIQITEQTSNKGQIEFTPADLKRALKRAQEIIESKS